MSRAQDAQERLRERSEGVGMREHRPSPAVQGRTNVASAGCAGATFALSRRGEAGKSRMLSTCIRAAEQVQLVLLHPGRESGKLVKISMPVGRRNEGEGWVRLRTTVTVETSHI